MNTLDKIISLFLIVVLLFVFVLFIAIIIRQKKTSRTKILAELAEFLHGIQKTPLKSVIEWEDILNNKRIFNKEGK